MTAADIAWHLDQVMRVESAGMSVALISELAVLQQTLHIDTHVVCLGNLLCKTKVHGKLNKIRHRHIEKKAQV